MGLSCYDKIALFITAINVSMPSWAWVVTARMSNILNFSWYFLCIPAIYKCILAYLPIFFNQLSKFLRCESPSTFLGTCLSHHSFIIFLVTNTNTLLSGLYLISTNRSAIEDRRRENCVNALSGLYLISTVPLQKPRFYAVSRACFCRYLSEYSDKSSFLCMFTIWTHLTRQIFPPPEFTIAQNYSSVILFFHQNYRRTHSLILSLTPVRNMLRQHLHPLPMDYN